MAQVGLQRGYYSVLRWRSDPTKDECRNVAVILVDDEGTFGGVKATAISTISPHLREQGILDSLVNGLEQRFSGDERPTLEDLRVMYESMQRSIVVTAPQACAVEGVDETLRALFAAHVGRPEIRRTRTKGTVLDQVVRALRRDRLKVQRGDYVDDFLFDAVVENGHGPVALDVLCFAQPQRKDWREAEQDAGHFLFGLVQTNLRGLAVLDPPAEQTDFATPTYERVQRWFEKAAIPVVDPTAIQHEPAGVVAEAFGGRRRTLV